MKPPTYYVLKIIMLFMGHKHNNLVFLSIYEQLFKYSIGCVGLCVWTTSVVWFLDIIYVKCMIKSSDSNKCVRCNMVVQETNEIDFFSCE